MNDLLTFRMNGVTIELYDPQAETVLVSRRSRVWWDNKRIIAEYRSMLDEALASMSV